MPTTRTLRQLIIEDPKPLLLPGAANALTARVIEELGFDAVYLSGAGISNTFLGVPDIGLLTMTEIVAHIAATREAVDIPIVVDADTGFGNAVNVRRTVREYGRAGANGMQLEDQISPKKCGHFEGKGIIPLNEMVGKIHSVVDSRRY
jgi:2-methylisocitrate lyase-like PEP mutase family enzyme